MYKAHHRQLPGYLIIFVIANSDIRNYNTILDSHLTFTYQSVSKVYLKRICSLDSSALCALDVLENNRAI